MRAGLKSSSQQRQDRLDKTGRETHHRRVMLRARRVEIDRMSAGAELWQRLLLELSNGPFAVAVDKDAATDELLAVVPLAARCTRARDRA